MERKPEMLDDKSPDGDSKPEPEPQPIKSKYEFVMAASKEAERLNEANRRRGLMSAQDAKVTVEAIRRIDKGLSRLVYEEQPGASEDQNRESTYNFFSS